MLKAYREHVEERAAENLPPKTLSAEQAQALVDLIKNASEAEQENLLHILEYGIAPGVDEAAYVKAGFLSAIAKGDITLAHITPKQAIAMLGTMQGGYNIPTLVDLLDDPSLQHNAAKELKHTLLVFDAFHDVADKAKSGNPVAKEVIESWAKAEWFSSRPDIENCLTVTVFKVSGETNTDDLSPAPDAWSRPDIPLHAKAMYKMPREGITNAETQIAQLKSKGHPVAFVGDVVGTGSSRKSATNSLLWYIGRDIVGVPNKRAGGICIGGKIAPIFFNTMEDAGALPIECDVSKLNTGDVICIYPKLGKITNEKGDELATFTLKSEVILDEVRVGGRIPLIIGRSLTEKACEFLKVPFPKIFITPKKTAKSKAGFTLAQKMVGRACNTDGIRPGEYCEPKMTTVGSQDTTGPMTRDELKDLACLGFLADLVMQSFCHTVAYPKPVDIETQHTLPDFIMNRGGISLRPGDGIIHSWINRMLLPDTVGTGADSHTRFPMGISFPAGSGLVAFAAATGVMPLNMPESVRVRFKGKKQPGITLRDLVHAIPYFAIQEGLLTVDKKGKKNIFSGRILEIEGLEDLTVEQAFELSDASAERSAAACTITLSKDSVINYLQSNITMLKWMISEKYGDARTIERRIHKMEEWLKKPVLLRADPNAEYVATLDIDLDQIKEPILCAPNDPDDAKLLSEVADNTIDEVFLGSCMTNIGHFRAAGKLLEQHAKGPTKTRFWIAPPTKMDKVQLESEGYYKIFEKAGVRTEVPGCSLCMGNQARVEPGATVLSTSTRNFPNRLGDGANVYLCSAELAAVGAILGHIPSMKTYKKYAEQIAQMSSDIYRYMDFHKMSNYQEAAKNIIVRVS